MYRATDPLTRRLTPVMLLTPRSRYAGKTLRARRWHHHRLVAVPLPSGTSTVWWRRRCLGPHRLPWYNVVVIYRVLISIVQCRVHALLTDEDELVPTTA